jgi:hypothetical protein
MKQGPTQDEIAGIMFVGFLLGLVVCFFAR